MTIVCATDFSPCSQTATRLAAAMARRRGDRILLIHVFEPPPVDYPGAPVGSGWERDLLDAAEPASPARRRLYGRAASRSRHGYLGDAASAVLEAAGAPDTSLIVVLGTHGPKGYRAPVSRKLREKSEQTERWGGGVGGEAGGRRVLGDRDGGDSCVYWSEECGG